MGSQGCRHTNNDGVGVGEIGKLGSSPQSVVANSSGNLGTWNVLEIALAAINDRDLFRVDITSDDSKSGGPRSERKRHSNISKTYNANRCPLFAEERDCVRGTAIHSKAA